MAEYTLIDGERNLELALAILTQSTVISYDLETTGLDAHSDKILLYGFRGDSEPVNFVTRNAGYAGRILAACHDHIFLAHNAAFEVMFTKVGHNSYPRHWFDTMLAEQLLTAGILEARHDLDAVIRRYCGNVHGGKALQTSFVGADASSFVATPEQLAYLADDVAFLHDVMHCQLRKLKDEGLLRVARLEMQALPAFAEMQLRGFYLNREKHKPKVEAYIKQEADARAALERALQPLWDTHIAAENRERALHYAYWQASIDKLFAEQGIARLSKDTPERVREAALGFRKERDKWKPKKVAPVNVASSDQVLAALAVAGVRPEGPNSKGEHGPSLDKNVLREMQHEPLVQLYTAWAKPAKAVSTYGYGMWERISPVTGRFHAGYRQCGAASGRTSTSPQIQNIPPDIRACFEAEPGNVLVVADAKNQEGRLAAVLSRDETLLEVFRAGIDWHSLTAAAAWPSFFRDWKSVPKDSPERARAKNGNFSSIYGGTGRTLHSRGYVDDLETGDRIMHAIAETYPVLARHAQTQANLAISRGWVETISGRKRYFRLGEEPRGDTEATKEWKKRRNGIRRSAMNHGVQGSGADVMKVAMALMLPRLKEIGWELVAFVHDEQVSEGPKESAEEAKEIVLWAMEEAGRCFTNVLPIPGEATITRVWTK